MNFQFKTKIPKLRLALSAGFVLLSLHFVVGCATGGGDESEIDDLAGSAAPADSEFAEAGDPLAQSDSDLDSQSGAQEGDKGTSDDEFLDEVGQSDQQVSTQNDQNQQDQTEPEKGQAQDSSDELSLDDFDDNQQAQSNPPIEEVPLQLEEPPQEEAVPMAETPPPMETLPPVESLAPVAPQRPIEITNLSYKANESGGTIIIEGSGPIA
jgi:type IV pilus assembly protein PilQ